MFTQSAQGLENRTMAYNVATVNIDVDKLRTLRELRLLYWFNTKYFSKNHISKTTAAIDLIVVPLFSKRIEWFIATRGAGVTHSGMTFGISQSNVFESFVVRGSRVFGRINTSSLIIRVISY